jgi:hypothetical protein
MVRVHIGTWVFPTCSISILCRKLLRKELFCPQVWPPAVCPKVRVHFRVTRCVAQCAAQPVFLSKLVHNFFRRKKWPKVWASSLIFKNVPKQNNRPKVENSTHLVTLVLFKSDEKGIFHGPSVALS